jgi:hypothetical protein
MPSSCVRRQKKPSNGPLARGLHLDVDAGPAGARRLVALLPACEYAEVDRLLSLFDFAAIGRLVDDPPLGTCAGRGPMMITIDRRRPAVLHMRIWPF